MSTASMAVLIRPLTNKYMRKTVTKDWYCEHKRISPTDGMCLDCDKVAGKEKAD
jgi:hypothetical protein